MGFFSCFSQKRLRICISNERVILLVIRNEADSVLKNCPDDDPRFAPKKDLWRHNSCHVQQFDEMVNPWGIPT